MTAPGLSASHRLSAGSSSAVGSPADGPGSSGSLVSSYIKSELAADASGNSIGYQMVGGSPGDVSGNLTGYQMGGEVSVAHQ